MVINKPSFLTPLIVLSLLQVLGNYNPRQKCWKMKQVLPPPAFNVDQVIFSLFVGKSDIFQN